MPRLPKLPAGSLRLFGRVDRFTVECPRCAQLIRAAYDASARSIGQQRRREAQRKHPTLDLIYNPLTSRLTCPRCRIVFAVGLLLYPVHRRSQPQQPMDTRPTWAQLLELRQQAGAYLIDRQVRGKDEVNLYVTEHCLCMPWFGRRKLDPRCPIHGDIDELTPPTPPVRGEEEGPP